MFNSKLIKEAHKLTKEIKTEFPEINYKFQLGLCISYLLKKENKMTILEINKLIIDKQNEQFEAYTANKETKKAYSTPDFIKKAMMN